MLILGNRIKFTLKEQQSIKLLTGLHHIPNELDAFKKALESVIESLDTKDPESKLLANLIKDYIKI